LKIFLATWTALWQNISKMKKEQFFSRAQLRELRKQYDQIKRVDPDSLALARLEFFVGQMPEPMRAQLAANNIPWVSYMARRMS